MTEDYWRNLFVPIANKWTGDDDDDSDDNVDNIAAGG